MLGVANTGMFKADWYLLTSPKLTPEGNLSHPRENP